MLLRRDGTTPEIDIELLRTHDEGGALLTQAVPIQIWTGVVITQEVITGLSVFERFTLECLVQLDTCGAEDICEVIGIDHGLAKRWLEIVEMKGLATRQDEATFIPNVGPCVEALAKNSIKERKEAEKTIAWFAQTSEMILLGPNDPMIRILSKVKPKARFEIPNSVAHVSRGSLIEQSLDKSLLYGDEAHSIIGVKDSTLLGEDTCAAYLLEINLDKINHTTVETNVYGHPAKKEGQHGKNGNFMIRQPMSIPTLPEFIGASLKKVSGLSNSLSKAMEGEGFLSPQMLQNSAVATLNYDKALSMLEEGLLSSHKRIRFTIDSEMVYEIPFELIPADDKTASLINLDSAVRALLELPISEEALDKICIEYDVSQKDVSKRLWQLKQYAMIYQLREQQDFNE
jgi:hypothetical protein